MQYILKEHINHHTPLAIMVETFFVMMYENYCCTINSKPALHSCN